MQLIGAIAQVVYRGVAMQLRLNREKVLLY
jgi:hypothetical protein